MSVPISAMMSCAVMMPKPGTASSCPIWCRYGSHNASILADSSLIWAVRWSMFASIMASAKACSAVKKEQSRASSSCRILPRIRVRAICASTFGVAFARR